MGESFEKGFSVYISELLIGIPEIAIQEKLRYPMLPALSSFTFTIYCKFPDIVDLITSTGILKLSSERSLSSDALVIFILKTNQLVRESSEVSKCIIKN